MEEGERVRRKSKSGGKVGQTGSGKDPEWVGEVRRVERGSE